jgi:hypothetical protein
MNGSSVEANDEGDWAGDRVGLMSALSRMQEALRLLDESDAPPQIGAQLDLAVQQLKQAITELEAE